MFKKPVECKALQRLSGADMKKLRRNAKERFPLASDADIDAILPPKAEVMLAKYQNRAHVYSVEGFPVLFDVDGRGSEIFPTVYALWKSPYLLPAFMLKGAEVSRFVIGGADLMFPGISIPTEGLPSFLSGQPYSIKVPGNPAPIAVGATTMSTTEAMNAGLRGKALRILHCYHDSLWDSAESRFTPNSGFFEDIVLEDPSQPSEGGTDAAECEELDIACSSREADGASVDNDDHNDGEELASNMNEMRVSTEDKSESKQQKSLLVDEVNTLLDRCLLQALHTTVKEKDLPLPGSTLWSNHILPCRPPGVTLDIKKSTHKKLSKWLQSKSLTGLISVKEDKYNKEVMLMGVNRDHPDYISFRPEKRGHDNDDQKLDPLTSEVGHPKQLFEVTEIYKPSSQVQPIFISVEADTGRYYSAPEASDIVFRYVEKEKLVKPLDKAMVILDAILCDALFKGTIKKGARYPTEIHKKDLGPAFLSRMQVNHRVSRGNDVAVRKGAIKALQITTERRQGNKKVTKLVGMESFLVEASSLASELQKKFACSTTVAELPGKKGQYEVLIQGCVVDDLANHLTDQYGIPKRYMEVLDKTKKSG